MDKVVILSYAGALILLYLCIVLFIWDCQRQDNIIGRLILLFGMIPGLAGVLFGFYLFVTLENREQGLGVLIAWLLLELGAFQLRHFSKSFVKDES